MCSSQGGIRVPALIRMPPTMLDAQAGILKPGGISHEFATCRDLMPTFLDLGGARHPVPGPERGTYKGREGVLPMTGKSWVPWLLGKEPHVYGDDEEIGWELHGRAAFRKGKWKILFMREYLARSTSHHQLRRTARVDGSCMMYSRIKAKSLISRIATQR